MSHIIPCIPPRIVDPSTSDIIQRLRFSEQPTDNQSAEAKQILRDAELDLEDYDAQAHPLQAQLDLVNTQRKLLKNYIAANHSLLSPVHKLPNEILISIFSLCGSNIFRTNSKHDFSSQTFWQRCPTLAFRWHELIHSTPQLWSGLDVTIKKFTDSIYDPLSLFLQRSEQYPLSLRLVFDTYPVKGLHELPALERLSQHFHRLKHLEL
ncbi:hypothetical protein D9758_001586 [Tetrapyrgos nigripes]|uniref:F-box domain-containing protein n=1 Tax=Tetrapyrgos nigripes TaxID=182062 RepID=A0A8H5GY90_9AGAR|nr:hypothetical protein D9758_001586 [Tetrapyrgos nigripes]